MLNTFTVVTKDGSRAMASNANKSNLGEWSGALLGSPKRRRNSPQPPSTGVTQSLRMDENVTPVNQHVNRKYKGVWANLHKTQDDEVTIPKQENMTSQRAT